MAIALDRLDSAGTMANPTGWTYVVALYLLRRRPRHASLQRIFPSRSPVSQRPATARDGVRVDVIRAIQARPERERTAVVLRYVGDLPRRRSQPPWGWLPGRQRPRCRTPPAPGGLPCRLRTHGGEAPWLNRTPCFGASPTCGWMRRRRFANSSAGIGYDGVDAGTGAPWRRSPSPVRWLCRRGFSCAMPDVRRCEWPPVRPAQRS